VASKLFVQMNIEVKFTISGYGFFLLTVSIRQQDLQFE
jgi:hypothetical protein